jgi:soluble lytic murein transglycosylase
MLLLKSALPARLPMEPFIALHNPVRKHCVARSTMLQCAAFLLIVVSASVGMAQHNGTKHGRHHAAEHTRSVKSKTLRSHSKAHGKNSSRHKRRHVSARTLARVHQLRHAFVASSQLRPMAQQLITERTPQAYSGVLQYARSHSGEASAAAYMALGQAYFDDHKYSDAANAFHQASRTGQALDDYADYLGAKANFAQQQYVPALQLLENFAGRHPDSMLIDHASLLSAEIKLNQGDPQTALTELAKLDGSTLAHSSDYLFTLARANELAGNRTTAQQIYTRIYLDYPTSNEAVEAGNQLHQMGIASPFTIAQSMRHADGLYLAGRYSAAAASYQSLAGDPTLAGTPQQNSLLARAAVASFKQSHHVDLSQLARLADSNDEAGATRLYLSMEAARDRNDVQQVKALVDQLEQRFPTSRWTAEALFSGGNMALVANDPPIAIQYYGDLAARFPDSTMAPVSHWHAAWLNYRIGNKKVAAQLFDEQIARYSEEAHISAALYWRGVVYEEVEKNPTSAAAYYKKLVDDFRNYYYGALAQQRLTALGAVTPDTLPQLVKIAPPEVPELTDQIPDDSIHVERARLLANAGLNQYIVPEINAADDSATWGALAEAELYSSDGENWRALHILKQKVHSYFSIPIDSIPKSYWNLLFPQPYWPALVRESRQQNLDPYLVASLIRQESEFNPGAVSYANAWGLMQLLPSVGSELARKEHVHPFRTSYLLNSDVNLKLGTAYFRELMDEFQNHPEYALAAYNAGDNRVKAWQANGPYESLQEFVESIPFTQTREYVEAILRNREIYKQIYGTATPVR